MEKGGKKLPISVLIIALLLLLSGLTSTLSAFYILPSRASIGLLLFGLSLVAILIAIGLLKMGKWSLYLYTFWLIAIAVVMLYFAFFTSQSIFATLSIMLPGIIILVYLWSISKIFSP